MSRKDRFVGLATAVDNRTNHLSFVQRENPQMLEIIEMGAEALAYLLSDLQHKGQLGLQWRFHALRVIACRLGYPMPVVEEKDWGKVKVICQAWIDWGIRRDLV